ncbi:MAG: roadblock/LC7 domain-containing protein [Thermoplasmata archaeon]|nr:roadblock/LC7 domain-containing protein [Thermoplasmata archaeon]
MKEIYKKIINDLESKANIDGACIVSRDGLLIYSNMKDVHGESFAAMSATLLSSAEVAMDEIKEGVPKIVVVEGKNRKIVVVGAGPSALLAVVTKSDIEEIYEALKKTAKEISEALGKK